MSEFENWTDKELIQVYDLQKSYAQKIASFVAYAEDDELYQFLNVIPELNSDDKFKILEKEIYTSIEFRLEMPDKEMPQGRYIYKDLTGKWKGEDELWKIFREKYQKAFEKGRPTDLVVFAGNENVALEKYSVEKYEKIRKEIPTKLQEEIKNLIMEYPQKIEEKAFKAVVYGRTKEINSEILFRYTHTYMPDFDKAQLIMQQASANTIVAVYDLQTGLLCSHPSLWGWELKDALGYFCSDPKIFGEAYGDKPLELLTQASESEIKLAIEYDFVDSNEKIPAIENHNICLFGTAEQKIRLLTNDNLHNIADKDLAIIIEEMAKKYEQEGFSKKYYPNGNGHKEYSNQSYKVVGRVKTEDELQPQWNIIFEDGKIITAQADEVISSQINERFYGEQVENFGKRPLSKVLIVDDKEKLNLAEGKEKISAIIRQLQKNGESVGELKDFLEEERKNLSKTSAR